MDRSDRPDVAAYNRAAWDRQAGLGNRWTIPVGPDEVSRARAGDWSILLTPTRPVPRAWFGTLAGAEVLCLAGGGGQQGPILAAAGARVTVFDNSPAQLAADRAVAGRDGLSIATVAGDMADLSAFDVGRFDLIVHPVANVFAPAIRPVWREASRVLRPGGAILAGFMNPVVYLFGEPEMDRGELVVRHPLPYSDVDSLDEAGRARVATEGRPLEFGHSLDDQIGGQVDAGLAIVGFYEDSSPELVIRDFTPIYIATRAVRLG